MTRGAATIALCAGAILGTGSAFADAGEDLDSWDSDTSYAWSHDGDGNDDAWVKDTKSDSYAVYNLYDRRYNTGLRLDNSNGYGTTANTSNSKTSYVTKVEACTNKPNWPDSCGLDDRDGDGR